jgi:type I restriction enzyme S subunit
VSRESNNDLPSGWEIAPLAALSQINPPLDRCVVNDAIEVNFVPMRAVESEGAGLVRPEARPYGEVKKGYTSFLSGDVIMAKITPCMENGKTTVVPNLPGSVCFGSTEFHVIRPETGALARWIAAFLVQHEIRRNAQRAMSGGVGQMRVPAAFLESLRIPIAPTAEQERIADALDELLSDLDAGVAALERVRDKLKLYRAAVLNAAVEGALSAEWRKHHLRTEPASELLKRILAERRRRREEEQLRNFKEKGREPPKNWKSKYKEPAAPYAAKLAALPTSWCWATVEQLSSGRNGSIQSGPFGSQLLHSEFGNEGPLAIGIDNILDGKFSLGSRHRISSAKFTSLRKFEARALDVMVTVMATVGRVCVLPADLETSIVTKHCYRITAAEQMVVPAYLAIALRAEGATRHHIFGNIRGQTRPGINGPILKRAPVSLPPTAEQEAIVETVEDQLSIIDHLEADLAANLTSAQALRQSLLRHAFSGKLVSQDPKDEPASELLKRIGAEREQGARDAAAAKRLNGHEPRRALEPRRKAARTVTKESQYGRIADR